MKKALKKLIPTIIMVLIAASMVGTSTFAWFSMNSKVTVTGMSVTTRLSNNLLIWTSNSEANYTRAIHQTRSALLEPASTVNGVNYWYTSVTNVYGNGDAKTDAYVAYSEAAVEPTTATPEDATDDANYLNDTNAGKNHYDSSFNSNYLIGSVGVGNVAYAYVDYVFYLKGTNASSSAQWIYATKCNLLYKGQAIDADKAWRVAFFEQDTVSVDTDVAAAPTSSNLISILRPTGATYFSKDSSNKPVAISANAAPTTAVSSLDAKVKLKQVPANTTDRIKVTVRLWLEGEDTSCKNDTFANLTSEWQLDLAFTLDGEGDSNAVDVLGSTPITATINGLTGAVALTDGKLSNGEIPATYAWKDANGNAATGTNDTASYTAASAGNYYCVITTTLGNVYRTRILDLSTPIAATSSGAVGTVTLDGEGKVNSETPSTYVWKKADGTAITGTITDNTFTCSESAGEYVVYCEVTTAEGHTFRTNTVTLTVS